MTIAELKNKKVLILGLGKEGTSTLKLLRKKFPEKVISLADRKTLVELEKDLQKIAKNDRKLKLHLGNSYQKNLDQFDVIIKSPGLLLEKSTKGEVTSQTQIFMNLFKNKVIGITGTKGKTTTSSLIHKILKDAKINALLVGNVGNPPFDYLEKAKVTDIFVFELSSFQLQDLEASPHIAIFLNLYKEHLDYHGNFENYKNAKINISKWQNNGDFLIYNADFQILEKIAVTGKAKKIPFSINQKLKSGAYIDGEWLFFNQEKVLKISETKLKGRFNHNNILAAVSAAKILKIPNKKIASSVKKFEPVKHRIQFIGSYGGIDFINDSIATIPEATIAALETFNPNINTLIVGGYNRGLDYSRLSKKIVEEKIPNLILFPETGKIILEGIKRQNRFVPKYLFVKNMKNAVEIAAKITAKGKICLLSPASSSFNLFKNYQDRGEQFQKYVRKLS